jgi:hypothetical protein
MEHLPASQLAFKTARGAAGGLPASEAGTWSMPPQRVVELIAPRAMGHIEKELEQTGWYWGAGKYPVRRWPFLLSIYLGTLTVVLSVLSLVTHPLRLSGWAGMGTFGFLLAIGAHAPLWGLARRVVPVMDNLRYPERFFLMTVVAVVILSCFGFDLAIDRNRAGTRRCLIGGLLILAALSCGAGIAALLAQRRLGAGFWTALGAETPVAPGMGATLLRDGLLMGALAAGYAMILVALHRNGKRLWPALLIVLGLVDLVVWGRPLAPTASPFRLMAPPPVLARLLDPPLNGPLFHHAGWDPRRRFINERSDPPMPSMWGIATTLEDDFDVSELAWSRGATLRFFDAVTADPALAGPLLARRGVAAVIRVTATDGTAASHPARPPSSLTHQVLIPREKQPFVFCAERIESVRGEEGWLEAARRLGNASARSAIVDQSESNGLPESPSPCHARLIARTPVRLDVDVEGQGPEPSFLAVNQTWDADWDAAIDGQPVRLVKTDLSLSGVVVPPGRHRVTLIHHDVWIPRGIAISLAALGVCALGGLLAIRRGRNRPDASAGGGGP